MDINNVNFRNVGAVEGNGSIHSAETLSESERSGLNLLKNLSSNDVFIGTITDISEGKAQIQVGDNSTIYAKLESNNAFSVGQSVVFQVGSEGEDVVSLKALFTNMATQNIAGEAINQANLPINEMSMAVVSTLMEEGLAIDKDTLASVYRAANLNPEVPLSEISKMVKIGLELSNENIMRFDAVFNFESKITDSIETMIGKIPFEIASQAEGDLQAAMEFASNVLENATDSAGNTFVGFSDFGAKSSADGEVLEDMQSNMGEPGTFVSDGDNSEEADNPMSLKENDNTSLYREMTFTNKDLDILSKVISDNNEAGTAVLDKLSNGEKIELNELLNSIKAALNDPSVSDSDKANLLKSDLFKNALEDRLSEKWLLEPGEIKDTDSIKEHLNKVIEDTGKIIESMNNTVKGNESLSQSVSDFAENVRFLQTLNDLTPYVQLPMRLNKEANTGDLYVYANKKNLLEKKENISALLRLDMKSLGRVEVYVRLNSSTNVSTDFTLEDEDTLRFVENHIDMLNERLEKLGYNVSNSFSKTKSAPELFDEDIEPGIEPVNKDMINFTRFDTRA